MCFTIVSPLLLQSLRFWTALAFRNYNAEHTDTTICLFKVHILDRVIVHWNQSTLLFEERRQLMVYVLAMPVLRIFSNVSKISINFGPIVIQSLYPMSIRHVRCFSRGASQCVVGTGRTNNQAINWISFDFCSLFFFLKRILLCVRRQRAKTEY